MRASVDTYRSRDIKPGGDFFARATVGDELQDLALAPAQSLKRIVPDLYHLLDVSEHVARLVCRISSQRRAFARPHDPAVPTAITSVARNLLMPEREQFLRQRVAVFSLGDVRDVLVVQFSLRVAKHLCASLVHPDYV